MIRFGWDDYTSASSSSVIQTRVAYVSVPDASGQAQLHRLVCAGSASVTADTVLAHGLVSVSASCASAAGPTACSGSGAATPVIVKLSLSIHDPQNVGAANYQIELTGQRRQS